METKESRKTYQEVGLPEFDAVERKAKDNGDILYILEPKGRPECCRVCGGTSVHVHKKSRRNVQDLDMLGHRVGLTVVGRTYRCADCGELIRMEYPSLYGRMTTRLASAIQEDCLRHTFTDTARRFHTTTTTVKALFEEYADERLADYKLIAPRVLGIDEVHLEDAYRGVFVSVDQSEGRVVEFTEKRTYSSVVETLCSMSGQENLELITIDMWRPYRDAVNTVFPGVPVVVDHFYVIKNLMKALDTVRSQICRQVKAPERRALKRNRYLLLCSNENLTVKQGADLAALLKAFPEFEDVYLLKESFRDIYATAKTSGEAKLMFDEWCCACKAAGTEAYDGFIKTVRAWETEIFAYFDFPGMARTNAQTESLNRSIRTIARAGRGYTFDVLRKKVLLARYPNQSEERFSFSDFDD